MKKGIILSSLEAKRLQKALPEKPATERPLPTGAHRTPPKGYPEKRSQYAIPSEYKYPIDTRHSDTHF